MPCSGKCEFNTSSRFCLLLKTCISFLNGSFVFNSDTFDMLWPSPVRSARVAAVHSKCVSRLAFSVTSRVSSLSALLAASVTCPLRNRSADLPLQGIPQSVLHRGTCTLCLHTRLLGIMESRNASASAFALLCSERSLLGVYWNHKAFQKVTVRKFLDDVVYPDMLET